MDTIFVLIITSTDTHNNVRDDPILIYFKPAIFSKNFKWILFPFSFFFPQSIRNHLSSILTLFSIISFRLIIFKISIHYNKNFPLFLNTYSNSKYMFSLTCMKLVSDLPFMSCKLQLESVWSLTRWVGKGYKLIWMKLIVICKYCYAWKSTIK